MKNLVQPTPYAIAAALGVLVPALEGAAVSHVVSLTNQYGHVSAAPVFGKKSVALVIRTMFSEWMKDHISRHNLEICEVARKYLKRAETFRNQIDEVCNATPIDELIADYNTSHSGLLDVREVK